MHEPDHCKPATVSATKSEYKLCRLLGLPSLPGLSSAGSSRLRSLRHVRAASKCQFCGWQTRALCARAQELQDVNRKQLAVLRQLSQEHEQERAALRAGVEAEARDAAARLGAELDELKAQRERQEVLPGYFCLSYLN
jgi:hypothetical protein